MKKTLHVLAALLAAAALATACRSVRVERATLVEPAATAPAAAPAQAAPAASQPAAPQQPAAAPPAGQPMAPKGEVPQYTIEQFLATVNITGGSFSPDATKLLVSSDQTGIYNAYVLPVGGGAMTPLTSSTSESIFALGYFPRDERFLYTSDKGGNELNHVYVRELDGTDRDLTPGDKLKANFLGWSVDDQTFYIGTNERDERFFDAYELAVDGYARKMVYKNEQGFELAGISNDRRYIALAKPITTTDSDLYLHDTQTGETKHLTPHTGEITHSVQDFSPDSKSLYYTTDQDSEFSYLVRYDLETGQRTEVLRPDWDIWYAFFTRNQKHFIVGINNDAKTEVRVFDAATLQPEALPTLPDADITSVNFSSDDRYMTFYAETSRSPRNLYLLDRTSGQVRQLTRSQNPEIDPGHLADGQVVRFKSYDGVAIPGILYKPHQASAQSKLPAVISVHGGPGGQSRLGWDPLLQYLVNHGYVVYEINNRGSGGYGKTFFKMDDRKHGEADLDDCVASKKMLADLGYVDPERIGILGGSYGGYMVLAALAFRPQEFAAGVDIFGVANWVRTLQSIPSYWESIRNVLYVEMGNPETDLEYLRRISPLFHADKIERPLLVLQGANDPRVLKVESDEIVAAARKRGTPVEYIVFDDEGHGFVKKANQEKAYRAILEFLDKYLAGSGAARKTTGT